MQKLRRENQRLTEQLRKAEIVIDVQKKVGALLGWPLPKADPGEKPLMDAVTHLCPTVGVVAACEALGVAVLLSIGSVPCWVRCPRHRRPGRTRAWSGRRRLDP